MNKVVVISIIGLVVLGLILTFVLFSKSKKLPPPSPPPKPPPSPPPKPSTPPEVFAVGPDYRYTKNEAEGVCKSYGAEVATNEQLEAVQRAGAEWCFTGWLKDDNGNITDAKYPMQTSRIGCGDGPGIKPYTPPDGKAGVNCYGRKPDKDTKNILYFNSATKQWNQPEPEKCLKDEDCVELLKGGVKRAYKKCNATGALDYFCTVECKDQYQLEPDNITCKKKPYTGCVPGCKDCIGTLRCGTCLPGLKLVEGKCEFNPFDLHWTYLTGTACHCLGDCDSENTCKNGAKPYSYYGNGYQVDGCQISRDNINNMGYDKQIEGLPEIIQGIPALTNKSRNEASVPYDKLDWPPPSMNHKLPPELASNISSVCKTKTKKIVAISKDGTAIYNLFP